MRNTPPFRADHVGSLLRPPELLRAREDFAAGRIPAEEMRGVEDDAIRDMVRKQEDAGLRSVTDGEFRRASWHMDFMYGLDGIEKAPSNMKVEFHNAGGDIEFTPGALKVQGRIGLKQAIFGEAFEYLKSLTTNATTPKLTIPSPSMVPYRGGRAAINENITRTSKHSGRPHRRLRRGSPGSGLFRLHLPAV
jgi:5-methyltetrahydropteroyltriglutamate--homocysteine methyltransferase